VRFTYCCQAAKVGCPPVGRPQGLRLNIFSFNYFLWYNLDMRSLLFALVLAALTGTVHAEEGWFPYYFPADPAEAPDFQGLPASTFNAGKDVLDAPAGKHGFVKVKDGHFYFEDGTRARFWGTNLCFGACFPEHRDAEVMAGRIAYFGFNAVRLHHMDFYFEPNGIFEDIAPAYKNKQMKPTGHLSPRQLDKLDYLIYQFKQRGIYININTLVSRFFTEADGVVDAGKLGMAAKPVSLFDARLIELQKQYAKDLLTHMNPYTKLRYRDDPAVCLVEITNENTLTELNPSSLPEYYRKEFESLFNKWLADKYGSAEKAKDAWRSGPNLLPSLSSPRKRESIVIASPPSTDEAISKWTTEEHNGAKLTRTDTKDGTILTVNNVTGTSWHLQFRYNPVKLKKGKGYLFKFTAKSDKPLTIGLVAQQAFDPWKGLGLSGEITLNAEFKTFEAPFTANADCDNSKVGFLIGNSLGVITIKEVVLAENGKAPDIKAFLADTERIYLKGMRAYLRDNVGIKVPIGIGGHWNPAQLKLQQECLDYVDKHAYWDHPKFPRKSWDINDFGIHGKSIFADKNRGIIGGLDVIASEANQSNMPFVLSEWNHCYPNQYAYETTLLLAEEAAKNDWDALFQFAWAHSGKDLTNYSDLNSYFNINPNAQQLILCSFASRIFLDFKGDVLKRAHSTYSDSYVKVGCPFLGRPLKIGEIKNTDSGWNSKGRFNWGTAPTLMKK
jgi:hypothetical protein